MKTDAITKWLAAMMRARVAIVIGYALLVPIATFLALHIPNESGIERLMVPSDPDHAATRAFEKLFPERDTILLVFESPDPWSAASVANVEHAKHALAQIPHVMPFSALDALRLGRPDASDGTLRILATGTPFFRSQGLVGDHYLTIMANLDVHNAHERDAALHAITTAVGPNVHAVGAPFFNSWLEHASSAATIRSFTIFGVLLVTITLFLYRSPRALLAIVLSLGTTVVLALAAGKLIGFTFTIVSALVPLTVMVTTLATLTYLHSRFVDQPPDVPLAEHHLASLRSKLKPVTASTIAAATGFAALAVSHILPIRQLGIWTAIGLVISWVVSYTLFPALQLLLRTPTRTHVLTRTKSFDRLAESLPLFTYNHRRPILISALVLSLAGLFAITGIPNVASHLPIQVDALSNIDPNSKIARDARWFQRNVMDLNVAHVWIHLPSPLATDPDVLRAVDRFQSTLATTTDITGVAGPTTPLRMRSYLSGHGEQLAYLEDVEQLMLMQPDLRSFISPDLSDFQLTILFRHGGAYGYRNTAHRITAAWNAAVASSPALAGAQMHVVGNSLLEAKVGASLVPTLAESFIITVVLILLVFLVVFRSGLERLLAMIPSVFALLVTFLGLRVFGGNVNIATIIIATTVLGTTENDQMHFFHHMHESTSPALEDRLHHTFRIAGRAIFFATLINAIGFLGLATSTFPPLRQFGLMTSAAFVLALIADFVVLPAALWGARHERPAGAPAATKKHVGYGRPAEATHHP
jgi:hypothetical protein